MIKDPYYYALPKDRLFARFSPVFLQLKKGLSTTLLAVPHTGRTNNLRFLSNDDELLQEFGFLGDKQLLVFIDSERVGESFESFLSELLFSLLSVSKVKVSDCAHSALVSRDAFLMSKAILDVVGHVSRSNGLMVLLSLNAKFLPFIQEVDRLVTQMEKAAKNYAVAILWSCDTTLLHAYSPGHASSTLFTTVRYYHTFTAEETEYSVARFLSLRGEKLAKKVASEQLIKETGGIAGLFKNYLSVRDFTKEFVPEAFFTIPYVARVVKTLQKERTLLSSSIRTEVLTAEAMDFLDSAGSTSSLLGSITLKGAPTSQDVRILQLLQTHLDTPVSRDQVALALWGENWSEQYSAWALDQALSRLRRKLDVTQYKLITIKNFGYQLIKLI